MTSKSKQPRRKTVAVLVDYMNLFAGGFEAELRSLFERFARAHDLNLVFVYGRAIAHPDPGFAAHNRIYELVGPRCVSAVVALSSSITSYCGLGGARTLFRRYATMARCSVGLAVPGVPSIEVDNRVGMRALLEHLISHHAYRRIVFVRGPADNVEENARFAAYRQALSDHGLDFDEQTVQAGDFSRRSGKAAVERLLARVDRLPEAIVFANDGMALGAISHLRARGISVPRDVAVTGFDDLVMARLGDPPLTTVSQPVERMVERAVDLIVRQLAGHEVPEVTAFASQFVVRSSCGCGEVARDVVPASIASVDSGSREGIAAWARERHRAASRSLPSAHEDYRAASRSLPSAREDYRVRLLDALAREFAGEPGALVREVDGILFNTEANETYHTLQELITCLRREFAPVATREFDEVCYLACAHVGLANTRRQEQLRLDHDQAYYQWIDVGEGFSGALDLPTLGPALARALLTIGIDHAFISRYPDARQQELECIVDLRNGTICDPPQRSFPSEALMPEGAFPEERRVTFLAFPLAFRARNFGVAVFELRETIRGYPIVRDQISAVLQSIALHQEIIDRTRLHERRSQEQERRATAQRIRSLSVLAGGVAHDLNNVLGPLAALPDLMATELERVAAPADLAETNLVSDLETIKTAASRATQTIRDLLTLARQGHVAKKSLDLNQTISHHVVHEGRRAHGFDARVTVDLCAEPLHIMGSETHIGRAITNLVRNALDATQARGQVTVRTGAISVNEPFAGYETVERGEYAVVSVSDTGSGISVSQIGRLFEPFFSMKQLSDQSGSGLGLAIVHGVVKEHGGFIHVESTAGMGTTFTLYLPRCEALEERTSAISVAPRGQARILVVDDEPLQLRTCRRVLTHLGYDVATLSSGQETLAHLRSVGWAREDTHAESSPRPYELVILDMHLNEEHDGLWLFDRICSLYPGQRGLIASGHAPSRLVEMARQRGLAWLAKPYTHTALARAVHSVLGNATDRGD